VPFAPSDLTGLRLWLDAQAITGKADGDTVTTWTDLSPDAVNAVKAASSQAPVYKTNQLNGHPIVQFPGFEELVTASRSIGGNDAMTLIMLCSVPTATYYGMLVTYGSAGAGDWNVLQNASTGQVMLIRPSDNAGAINTTAVTGRGFLRHCATISAADVFTLYENNVQVSTATLTGYTLAASGIIQIGARDEAFRATADYAEIILYDRLLTSTERGQVDQYLQDHWAVAATFTPPRPVIRSQAVMRAATI
jgi:large repetitive protein